jgi:hypothetical protein
LLAPISWRSLECSVFAMALISHRLDQMYLCEGSFIILYSVKSWKNWWAKRACGSGTKNTKLESPVIRRSGKKQLQLLPKCRPAHGQYYFRHWFQPFVMYAYLEQLTTLYLDCHKNLIFAHIIFMHRRISVRFPAGLRPALLRTQPSIQPVLGFSAGSEAARACSAPNLLSNRYWGFLPGVKRPGRVADHSLPSSAEIKSAWSYISTHSLNGA